MIYCISCKKKTNDTNIKPKIINLILLVIVQFVKN